MYLFIDSYNYPYGVNILIILILQLSKPKKQ